MILLHRITPFVLAIVLLGGMYATLVVKTHFIAIALTMTLFSLLLLARLLRFEVRTFQFWQFLLTPILFLMASLSMIFFLEQEIFITVVAVLACALVVLYAEYVFQYLHIPATYQPYSLEYLSLFLNLLTVFFLSSVGFGSILLLQAPLTFVAFIAFALFLFIIYGTFWVSKAHESKINQYAVGGSVLMTELFVAVSVLPSGFYTNAAIITILFYLFIGLTRAHVLRTLSFTVVRRYLVISAILLLAVILSSQWL